MKIGILGFGKEGQSAEKYFQARGDETQVFDHFTSESLAQEDFSGFDLVLRSPSVRPRRDWSSMTRYFFDHCPCQIIGVTGTKGKGTTCSIITSLLKNLGKSVHLVGNIGNPAIDVLDRLTSNDIVVYEMSSFQLWDLEKSPHIAVITSLEPDHLNVHADYDEYVQAKTNITIHQTADDYLIYHLGNPDIAKIAEQSPSQKIAYPSEHAAKIDQLTAQLTIPGQHNQDNAEAALFAVACALNLSIENFLEQYHDTIIQTFAQFRGLPHRLEFLRELNHVRYYDDNFSTTLTSLDVALKAFSDQPVVLIVGGRDKTNGEDLPKIVQLIQEQKVAHVILLGESGRELYQTLRDIMPERITLAETLADVVKIAREKAESLIDTTSAKADSAPAIVLMSPAAASFDMFENVYDRGAQFQKLIQELS